MKIGIACYPTFGGSGVVATELGLQLAKRGHEIHIISQDAPVRITGYQERVFIHTIDIGEYPLFKYPLITLTAASKMIEIAQSYGIEIMHAHYAVPWAVCAHLAREVLEENGQKLKVVTTLHGTDITLAGSTPAFYEMTRHGIRRSDAVTAVSADLARATKETFSLDRQIEVIHNFVDSERFCPRPTKNPCCRSQLAQSNEKIIVHISNFRPVKNIPAVIHSFAIMRKIMPAKLLLVGEGPELPNARALVKELGLTKDVRFMGNQQAVEDILACADLFLLPSHTESFGLSALEAMSCGVPVIASNAGGLPEVITDGVDGLLCNTQDYQCLAAAALSLLYDNDKRAEFGKRAREKAVTHFHPDTIVSKYEAVYRSLL